MEMIEEENDIVPGLDVTRQTQDGFLKASNEPISVSTDENRFNWDGNPR